MKLLNLALFVFISLFVERIYAQQTNQWGAPVLGAQLSIGLDTNTVSLNSTPILYAHIDLLT